MDMTDPNLIKNLVGWISSRMVRGVMIAFPCATWSMASHFLHRNLEFLGGRPGLTPAQQAKVDAGNAAFRGMLLLLAACLRAGVPVLLENPA
eukprot:4154775-Pyramimonas_sp.AAC.1